MNISHYFPHEFLSRGFILSTKWENPRNKPWKEQTINYNEICGFTPYFSRQHRDFIKITIKYKDFKHYWIQPDESFFPNPRIISHNSVPREGETQSLNHALSIHTPKIPNKPRQEDNSRCLNHIPWLIQKETGKAETKNWLKPQDYHFKYWWIVKSKIPLILQEIRTIKEQNLINPKISQYTRMKSCKNIKQIWGLLRMLTIYWGFKCNNLKSRSEKPIKETGFRIECTM